MVILCDIGTNMIYIPEFVKNSDDKSLTRSEEFLQIQSKHLAFDEIIKEFSKWIDFKSLERELISPSKTGVGFIINILGYRLVE